MDDWFEELYEDYLTSYRAWGHQYVEDGPLDYNTWLDLRNEAEEMAIQEECGHLTDQDQNRREQIERLLLEHESYFEDGPRVIIALPEDNT